jgi:transposase-like protein
MVSVPVQCPYCQNTEVSKAGKQAHGTQRSRCQNKRGARRIFLLQYLDRGRIPEVRRQAVEMAIQWQWGPQHRPRVAHQSHDRDRRVKKKPPRCNMSTSRCSPLLVHEPPTSQEDAPPSSMKCGVSPAPKRVHGGCGMRLIMTQGEYLLMWGAHGRRRCS